MTKNVEKFKKELDNFIDYVYEKDIKNMRKQSEILIKMYKEREKPIIRCSSYDWVWEDKINNYMVNFTINKIKHQIRTYNYEEKGNVLITDDFIFVKENF